MACFEVPVECSLRMTKHTHDSAWQGPAMVRVVRRRLLAEEAWVQSQSTVWGLWSAKWQCRSFLTEPCSYDSSSAARSSAIVRHVKSVRVSGGYRQTSWVASVVPDGSVLPTFLF